MGYESQPQGCAFGVLNRDIDATPLSKEIDRPALVRHGAIYILFCQRKPTHKITILRLIAADVIHSHQRVIDKQLVVLN
jgi:hypothetical protein